MIFRVSDALTEIAPFVDGGGVDARCEPGRSQAIAVLNRAIRQLMNEGDWHGMTPTICLPVRKGGVIVLDERFETIRLAKWKTGSPIPIYSEGFKFLDGGLDPEATNIPSLVDLGETTPLHYQLPRAMTIMAYSEQVERDGLSLEIRGTDETGREALFALPIRHSWRSPLPPAYTGPDCEQWLSGRWASISELRKPVTRGLIHVFAYDPATGDSVWLTTLRPETISPVHRRYAAPAAKVGHGHQIVAKVVLRWYPVHFESDVLPVQNIDAIARMAQALHSLDTGDAGRYEFYRNSAVSQLRKQLSRRERPAKTGLQVSMSRGPSRIGRGHRGAMFSCGPSRDSLDSSEESDTETTVILGCTQPPVEEQAPQSVTV